MLWRKKMKLPDFELCQNDPDLSLLRDNDARGYLCRRKGTNQGFLVKRRVNYSLELLKKYLTTNKEIPLADFACGTGDFGLRLVEMGYAVDFMDNEKKCLDYIKLKADSLERVNLVHMDNSNYKSEKKYGAIFFGEAIEHMADPEATLLTLRDNLVNGGMLCLTTPNGDFFNGSEPKWNEVKHDTERNKRLANTIGNHVCEFGFKELEDLVKQAGFGIREHRSINSDNISKHSLLRRLLPQKILWKLDSYWSGKNAKSQKYGGRIQVIIAQRFH